ncbi:hypothetical protein ACOME3_001583 [Neoechinorhynchus agilis]
MHKKSTKSTLERSVHRLKLLKLNHHKGFNVCFDFKNYHKRKKSNVRQVTPARYVIRGDWFAKQLSTDIFKESPLPPTPEPLKKVKDMTIDEQTSIKEDIIHHLHDCSFANLMGIFEGLHNSIPINSQLLDFDLYQPEFSILLENLFAYNEEIFEISNIIWQTNKQMASEIR